MYFIPHESANTIAAALFRFESLAQHESYRIKSADDTECSEPYEFAKKQDALFLMNEHF